MQSMSILGGLGQEIYLKIYAEIESGAFSDKNCDCKHQLAILDS